MSQSGRLIQGFVPPPPGEYVQTLTANSGGAVGPDGSNNINVIGDGTTINIVGDPGTNTLTASTTGSIPDTFNADTGSAIPASGIIVMAGGIGINTAASGHTVTYNLDVPVIIAHGGTDAISFNTNGVVISNTSGTGALAALSLSSGEVVIGGTSTPAAATLTAGTGISITNGNNSIIIASTSVDFTYTDESTTFNALSNNGYFVTAAATATMPASPSQGDRIEFIVDTTSTLTVTGNTGQTLRIGSALSAAAGTATNNARGDAVTFIYRSSDTEWIALSVIGTWVVT